MDLLQLIGRDSRKEKCAGGVMLNRGDNPSKIVEKHEQISL
jgi:hypothetical protein